MYITELGRYISILQAAFYLAKNEHSRRDISAHGLHLLRSQLHAQIQRRGIHHTAREGQIAL
jgi:hypothetical protein